MAAKTLACEFILMSTVLCTGGALRAQGPTQSLQGRVVNGTTGAPVAKAEVNYVLMQRGPTPVATQTTDAQGRFSFDNVPAPVGGAPALLRADYQGATYNHPLLPGQRPTGEIQIQVFEAGRQPSMVSVREHVIFLHPSGNVLLVLEQVILENNSNPPKTYVNPNGTYPFTLPGASRDGVQVSVEGAAGMPLNQTPVPRDGKNTFAITYPIRPGETQVRLQYALDYKSPFEFSKPLDVLPQQIHVVTPGKEVQVTGDAVTALEADPSTGFTGYLVAQKGNLVRLEVTGEVPADKAAQLGGADDESGTLVPIAGPVSSQRWLILSAAGVVMLAGIIFHYSRSQ